MRRRASLERLLNTAAEFAIAPVLIGVCIGLSLSAPKFLAWTNFANVLDQVSLIGIIAVWMTLLLVSGNFDLSIGGMVALIGVLAARVMNSSGTASGILVALALGIGLGTLNGFIVTKLKVNSLVATLGTGFAFSGTALLGAQSEPVGLNSQSLPDFVATEFLGLTLPVYIFIGTALIGAWVLHLTVGGRQIYAVGGNREAARYAGINVDWVQFFPFPLTGLFCAVASLLLVGELATALPDAAQTWPLQVIAAVVVGGVSIAGGRGTIAMAVAGVLLIGVINNGFNLLNLGPSYQNITTGGILVAAVAVDSLLRARARVRAAQAEASMLEAGGQTVPAVGQGSQTSMASRPRRASS
jgi:ribose transport system permease protein